MFPDSLLYNLIFYIIIFLHFKIYGHKIKFSHKLLSFSQSPQRYVYF
nr:MAG TPA_asm: hypothetical protein [Caudoviricetes sp.]